MIFYNIKSAWRNLKTNRFYSLLHILGLGIGIATAVYIFVWVRYEKSFDKFNGNVGQIYRVNNAYATSDGNNTIWVSSPAPIRKIALQNKEVANCVRIGPDYGASVIAYKAKKIFGIQEQTRYVDAGFFSFFSLPIIKGDSKAPLENSNSVVLSAEIAGKLFGDEDPIGKTVTLHGKDPFIVSAVAENMPSNTSLPHIEVFLPMTFIAGPYNGSGNAEKRRAIDEEYGNFDYGVYVSTLKNSDVKQIEDQITKVYSDLGGPDVSGNLFKLQPLATMHLIDEYGSKSMLHLVDAFGWIGLLIVLIACINYVNLSTARALVRIKEVGVRKILGAGRLKLLMQFLSETALILAVAIFIASILITLFMPLYTRLTKQPFSPSILDYGFWAKVALVLSGTFLATAVYPAVVLSNFSPLQFMRGTNGSGQRRYTARRVLVVFQFSISVMIIFAALVMIRQMHYVRTKDVGYNRSLVFTVNMPSEMEKHSGAVIGQLSNNNAIAAVSSANANISQVSRTSGSFGIPGRSDINLLFNDMEIAPGFLSAMQMKLIKGRSFSGTAGDSVAFLLNQTAVKVLNLKRPVGQEVVYNGNRGSVIGVVRDFNFQSLKEKISPIIISSVPRENGRHGGVLYVRAVNGALEKAISSVEQVYKKYAGGLPFKYDFLDQNFNSAYASVNRTLSLLNAFSLVAVIISGLGLFGLATYTAEVKTKEIGIRRVMGASKRHIIGLITKDFVFLILLSTLIALPIGSWIMRRWLNDFAYKVTIGPWIFLQVTVFMMVLTWLIIGLKALQAASKSPVDSLKTE